MSIKGPRNQYLACHVTRHHREKLKAVAKQRSAMQHRKVSLSELVAEYIASALAALPDPPGFCGPGDERTSAQAKINVEEHAR